MSALRRALAVLPVSALALTAPSAQAAEIRTLPCVPYASGEMSMPILGSGFTPGAFVRVSTTTPTNPTPSIFTSGQADGSGVLGKQTLPPSFANFRSNQQSYSLIATDLTNPAAPIQTAPFPFVVVRFGTTTNPRSPRRPTTRVTYTARGFTPGKPIYIHFRFAGKTRRSVSLGVASSPCGIASRRMRALPTRTRHGKWRAYTSQSKRFSVNTKPMWVNEFTIYRRYF